MKDCFPDSLGQKRGAHYTQQNMVIKSWPFGAKCYRCYPLASCLLLDIEIWILHV